MQKTFLTAAFTTFSMFCFMSVFAQSTGNYKQMMQDPSVNFYDVCEAADLYFETHDKGKGSGWKGYQRWKAEEEGKYFPSGDRSQVDPLFVQHAFEQFMAETGPYVSAQRSHGNGWRELGPGTVDNITSHYSPGVGRVEALYVDPNNDQRLYLGSRSGGFWRSTDGGSNWINSTDTLVASGVNCIGVSPTNPDSILINVRNGGNNTTHGIYRSTDGGLTWTVTDFNPTTLGWGGLGTNDQIYRIVYHPQHPSLVFVGTSRGLFRSTDGMQTWTQPLTTGRFTDIEFMPSDDQMVFLYDDTGNGAFEDFVMISNDLGQNFTTSLGINGNNGQRGHISTTPACDSCVYFASSTGVWESLDYGNSFTFLSDPDETCRGFAVSDIDPNYMIYGYVDLERSSDGGGTFFQVTDWAINGSMESDYVHADLRVAECVNGVFYVGTDGFLCKSTDNGTNWTLLNNSNGGTGIREYYSGGLSQSDWRVQMAGSQDNGTSILDQTGWIEWNGGDGMEALVQPLRPDWMIGSWQFGTRNITLDAGQSRQSAGNPEGGSGNADWIAPLLMNSHHQMEIYHFGSSMYKSTSFGDNDWELVSFPNIGIVRIGAIAESNPNHMAIARNSTLRLSNDNGQTWFQPSGALPNYSISDIAFDPRHDSTIIVTYNRYQDDGQKIYLSHDMGDSWTNITENLNDMPLRTVVIDHTDDRNIYVGGEIGVYTRSMNGNSWTLYNPNLPNVTVRDLEVHYGTNVLRAFTWGRGLWDYKLVGRSTHPAITIAEISEFPMAAPGFPLVDQYVTAEISYDNTLSSVYVLWSDSLPTYNNSIPMSNTQDSTWESDDFIPHFDIGTNMYFKVVAVGAFNDTTETFGFHYVSAQEPPPIDTTTNDSTVGLDVLTNGFDAPVKVYPNPSDGQFTIEVGGWDKPVIMEVRNVKGQLVDMIRSNGPVIEVELEQEAGVYFMTLTGEDGDGLRKANLQLVIE